MPAEIRMETESPELGTEPKPRAPNANSFVQQTARKAEHTECPGKAADKGTFNKAECKRRYFREGKKYKG